MKRRKTVIAVFIMLTILLVGCGKGEDLTGRWVCSDEGIATNLELFSDGTGTHLHRIIKHIPFRGLQKMVG